MIRPYLGDIISDDKAQGEWKINSGNTVMENGELKYQWQLILYLLKILMKFVPCIQRVIK